MDEEVKARFELVELALYRKQARKLRRLEPSLDRLVEKEVRKDVLERRPDLIQGLGGWAKARVPVPTLGIGQRGGFRVIFFYLQTGMTVTLGAIYFKRQQTDLSAFQRETLRLLSEKIKKGAQP